MGIFCWVLSIGLKKKFKFVIDRPSAEKLAVEYMRQFYKDCDCDPKNNDELIEAMAVVINECAFLIKRFSNADRAQCELYVPYKKLMGEA